MKFAISTLLGFSLFSFGTILSFGTVAMAAGPDVTGVWTGYSYVPPNQYPNYFELSQVGGKIYGTQLISNGVSCTMTGTINGASVTLHTECPTVNYSSDSTATTDGTTMTGTFLDSQGTSGTFSAQKSAPATLSPVTMLDLPPAFRLQKQTVTFLLRKFTSVALVARGSAAGARKGKPSGLAVRYQVTLKGAERRKIVSARNRITATNLKPGNYTANYTVSAVRKDTEKKVFSTNTSPSAAFTVRK